MAFSHKNGRDLVKKLVEKLSYTRLLTVDFGEVKRAPTECKEKFFQMMSSVYLHYSKAPQNVLILMIRLRKRSAR